MKKTEEKILQGTNRSDRHQIGHKGDLLKLPSRPKITLPNDQAKKFYREVGKELIKMQILSKSDLYAFSMMCMWFGYYYKACHSVTQHGMIQKYKSGARNISPEFTAMEKADQKLQQYFRFFGLTPFHRERWATAINVKNAQNSQEAEIWESVLLPLN